MTGARYGLNILATLILGTLLARWFVRLPIETPIPAAIESALAFLGVDTIAHADDRCAGVIQRDAVHARLLPDFAAGGTGMVEKKCIETRPLNLKRLGIRRG